MSKSCAVFGFGYLGRPLAERLYQSGWNVAALKKSLTSDDINLPLDLRAADLADEVVFQTALNGWKNADTWIFLLPPSAVPDYAETVRRWVRAAEQGSVQQLIFTSSTSVYGDAARVVDEYSEPDPRTANAHKILAAETAVRNSSVPNRDIFRLGGLYCAERHPVYRLSGRSGIENGQHAVNILHRERAVAALAYAAEQPNGLRIRNLMETRHPSRAEFYRAEAVQLGLPEPEFADNGGSGKTVGTAYSDFAAFLHIPESCGETVSFDPFAEWMFGA
ncbi:MAG: GDP-L-fucose synthase [Neisseria sp.]|nr:GDP-L-fucose synthase [Neisseria sp.]